ncbi:MAG: phosphoribosyltransferase [Nitrospirae bacterium]|nr:phosphoribosyltransferase [Nitrospirota bacterium]
MSKNNPLETVSTPADFGAPIARIIDDQFNITLPKYFRDEGWANGIGLIQEEITRWAAQRALTPRKVIFDFNSCRWIDPLPLISILLEIANAQALDLLVDIRLPIPDAGPAPSEIGPYQQSPNRLLRFLDQEGFLDCLEQLKITRFNQLDQSRENYRNLHVKASYEDARCIPMSLFIVPQEEDSEFAKRSVEILLKGVDSKLASKIAPQTRDRLIYKLRVAVQEMLHNAQEHAYEEETAPRALGLYIRYRTGRLGLDSAGREVYRRHVSEERIRCPQLDVDWLTPRPGCIEVFMLDRGVGMVYRFEQANVQLSDKYKFNQVMQEVFLGGRSTKPERLTRYGGLHLLYNLLNETGDYIRALENHIWFGCSAPIDRPTAVTYSLTEKRSRRQGLAIHLRLGWKEETDYGDRWAKFGEGQQSEVWPELCLDESDCASSFKWFESKKVLDERFGQLKVYGEQSDWILWLVRPHRMKWDILNFLEYKVAPYATDETTLIIADIPSYEAETYAAALDEFKAPGSADWPKKLARIILSTNRWRFATVNYQKHGSRHGFSSLKEDFKKVQIKHPTITPKPQTFRLSVVRWLKWHDSRRLWEEVNHGRSMFIPEKIIWGHDQTGIPVTIGGYLDFPQTTRNSLCAAIYRISLARVLGVLPPHEVDFYPLDRLTLPVLQEIHAVEVYEPATTFPGTRLAIGSVLVSGSTLAASGALSLDLHFFVHNSSPLRKHKPSLLFWLPNQQLSESAPRLSRIGKTAAVAPEGWKSFEIPRFDENGKCIGFRDPQKTYQDWQSSSPVIVKAGHWSYEGHHDFLTLNIAAAVEAAFLEKNDLARFLILTILPFIGIDKSHIDKNWHRLLDDHFGKNSSRSSNQAKYGLLVYRSHPTSELVVRKLLNLLTPQGRQLAMTRISPILPIRVRWSGSSLLIPPLMRQEIRSALIVDNQMRPILLFDDAAITGRTIQDLRAALSALGATPIKTMVIVNRLRQPADGYKEERVDYYWRLDLPVMGREGNCPLCHALSLSESFSCSLSAPYAKEEIRHWGYRWGSASPLNNWSRGLRPLPLVNPEMATRYCYRQSPETLNEEAKHLAKIDLIRSTGLALHVAELHAMTGRDDYCLKKIREHGEPEIRCELAASQLLLFGNEFDLDVRVELVKILIRELSRLKEHSPHAPLAALAAMYGLGLLDTTAKRQAANAVIEYEKEKLNYVTKVLLAYLTSEELISQDSIAYKIGKRLLSTASWSLSQRLTAWFLEHLSPRGNAHSEAIPLLIDDLAQASTINDVRIKDALDSLDHLADIVDGLESVLVRKEASDTFGDKTAAMKKNAEMVRELITRSSSDRLQAGWRENTKHALETYVASMKAVADAFFHRIPLTKEYWRDRTFETKALTQIIKRIEWKGASDGKVCNGNFVESRKRSIKFSLSGALNFDSSSGEVWITWHRGIAGIVLDLLRNAVYSTSVIIDPWDPGRQEYADLWVRVDYETKAVTMIFTNASACNSTTVLPKLKKHRWSHLTAIGGSVEPIDLTDKILGIRISIPYAAYLGA